MVTRQFGGILKGLLRRWPAILLLGPRHCGRTTFIQQAILLIDHGRRRVSFEIKLHSAPTREDARSVVACMKDLGLSKGYVIHAGRHEYSLGDKVTALPAEQLLSRPADIGDR